MTFNKAQSQEQFNILENPRLLLKVRIRKHLLCVCRVTVINAGLHLNECLSETLAIYREITHQSPLTSHLIANDSKKKLLFTISHLHD